MPAHTGRWGSRLPTALLVVGSSVAVGAVYLATAAVSYHFVIPPSQSAVFWLPSGLSFALFVWARNRPRLWPGWLAAIFLAAQYIERRHGLPTAVALAWSLANVTLPLTAGLLARPFDRERFALRRVVDIPVFALLALVSVVPGALISSAAASRGLGVPFGSNVVSWATSDALAIAIVAPVILTWTAESPRPVPGRVPEALGLAVLILFASWIVFHRSTQSQVDRSVVNPLYFFIIWVAIRFDPRGTALVLLILDATMVYATTLGLGPFGTSGLPAAAQLLNLQILQATLSLVTLVLAAAIVEQRDARIQAEESLQLRDTFLSVAAHELHTPLASLQLSVQMLRGQAGMAGPQTTKLLDILERQVRRLTLLGGELLDTTRLRQGRLELDLAEVDLSEVVRETAEHAAGVVAREGSTLSVAADAPVIGHWDRLRLEQIVTNLVTNAAKFGEGKPIDVTVAVEPHDIARLTVTDHGIGISREQLPRVFDQYVQAVAPKHYGGLGLGLYIVRKLVTLLGGTVTVVSTVGEGSTFTVRLPLHPHLPSAT